MGICAINPLWVYSHRGEIFNENWDDWGEQIEFTHKYAVVFATEMAFELVGTAPHSPTAIASMGNYARGAFIATQLAAFISNLGYSATANHLRHYDALLVPLAVDAGLSLESCEHLAPPTRTRVDYPQPLFQTAVQSDG